MEDLKYINYNGEISPITDPIIKSSNRSFLYGDGLFESMHASGSEVHFLDMHYNRLLESADKLLFNIPSSFTLAYLERELYRLFHRSRYFKGARIRLSLFRNDGGLYTPSSNDISWVIQGSKLPYENYRLNKTGLTIGLFDKIKKPVNIFSGIKSANALHYVLAGIYRKNNNFDEVLLINDNNLIIETSSSNLFVFFNGKLHTAALDDGPLPGIMREIVIKIARKLELEIVFEGITDELLLNADEVFITNAVKGVQWVSAYKAKRYFNQISGRIVEELNRISFPRI